MKVNDSRCRAWQAKAVIESENRVILHTQFANFASLTEVERAFSSLAEGIGLAVNSAVKRKFFNFRSGGIAAARSRGAETAVFRATLAHNPPTILTVFVRV